MKSPQVETADYISEADKANYGDLQVMGEQPQFYVGSFYYDPEFGKMPGSRDSDYFQTREQAEKALRRIIARNLTPRMNP
jgi:hypothetical protein